MLRHAFRAAAVLAVAGCLAGCVDDIPDVAVSRGDVRQAIARGSLRSPRPATVAFASYDGAPDGQEQRFKALFDKEATDREIAIVDPRAAHYLVRAYLSASPAERGVDVAYVYDLFDAEHRRVDRISDTLTVPSSGGDPWSAVDDRVLTSLAGRGADDLAVILAGTPEAQSGQVASAAPR